MKSKVELTNLYWSAAGIAPGEGEISPFDIEARARSAARAGFEGISFWHTDLEHVRATRSLRDIKAILDDNGINAFEVEFIEGWFADGETKLASDRRRSMLFEASAALEAHHVKVGDFHNSPATMPRLIDAFGMLCEDAAKFGATIGFEFMASSMIHRLEDCLAMVEGATAPNGGLIVDIAHTTALGISNAAVAAIPGRYLVSVELNDNLLPSTPGYDPAARLYCGGDGAFDIKAFIAACRSAGYDGPWAVEVFNRRLLAGRSLDELNDAAFRSTMAQFD